MIVLRKRMSLVLGLAFSIAMPSMAQSPSIREVWKSVPQIVTPYLSDNNRLDFIDFMDSKMTAKVHNELNGESVMTMLNDRYLKLSLSKSSTLEMSVFKSLVALPDTSGYMICVVKTVGTDVQQSTIDLYTQKWFHLCSVDPASLLGNPTERPDTMSQQRYEQLCAKINTILVRASLSATEPTLDVSANCLCLSDEDKKALNGIFKQKTVKLNEVYVK